MSFIGPALQSSGVPHRLSLFVFRVSLEVDRKLIFGFLLLAVASDRQFCMQGAR